MRNIRRFCSKLKNVPVENSNLVSKEIEEMTGLKLYVDRLASLSIKGTFAFAGFKFRDYLTSDDLRVFSRKEERIKEMKNGVERRIDYARKEMEKEKEKE